MWEPISTAPSNCDLRLAVIDEDGTHSLIFPCRHTQSGWAHAITGVRVHVSPTHWQLWSENNEQE